MSHANFDFIVVGAGSAGCVLANRLSESGRFSVLLLEAGPADNNPWIHLPIGYGKTMFHPVLNWGFHTEPEPTMNQRKIYWPCGRCLGGSSSINGLIYIRGQAEDYDSWAAEGNPGWAWNDLLPYFIRSEKNSRGASTLHGDDGPLRVSNIGEKHELMEAIIAGAQSLGVRYNDDFNGHQQEGVGYFQLTTDKGFRCSTATAYLKPARRRKNIKVITSAQATRVLFSGSRASGITYLHQGKEQTALASREVILTAGALQSPKLLELSGVGDASRLASLGITVHQHLPGVGENLQDHLQLRSIYRVNKPITTNDDLRTLAGKARIGLKWLFQRSGPLAIGINQGGLFTRALPESERPDVQFHFGTLSADHAGAKPHDWSGCTFSVCQLRPESRGEIHIRSTDPLAAPAIHPRYLSADLDRRTAVAGLRLSRQLSQSWPLQPYIGDEYRPGQSQTSDEELLEFARNYGATIFHPAGTCRMGSDKEAVVDHRLKVHGLSGLRVADASIMPSLVSGNTNAPTIMIAEKAADLILEDASYA
ncbi:MAG: choline dehydrogenase [Betaproteobacteria bacterium]